MVFQCHRITAQMALPGNNRNELKEIYIKKKKKEQEMRSRSWNSLCN